MRRSPARDQPKRRLAGRLDVLGGGAELPVASCHATDQALGRDGQHPAQVFGGEQVQRATHRPGTDNLGPVQRRTDVLDDGARDPLPDGPQGGEVHQRAG